MFNIFRNISLRSWAFAKYLKYCQFIENTDLLPNVKSLANNYVLFIFMLKIITL